MNEVINPPNPFDDLKTYQFGQTIDDPYRLTTNQQLKRVTKIAIAIFAGLGIVAVVVGFKFAIVAAAVIAGSYLLYKVAKVAFLSFYGHRFRLGFEPGVNNENAPKLGTFSKADIRISNHVTESFEWKKQLISSATQSIELSANFAGGVDFQQTLVLIESRMEKHPDLKCHILLSKDLLEPEDVAKLKELENKYPNFHSLITNRIYTTTPILLSEENHVKLLVVDGQYFTMGGTGIHEKMTREMVPNDIKSNENFKSQFIDTSFKDSDIIGYGNVAQTMRNQFFNLYRIWEYRMIGKSENRYFPIDPIKFDKCELFHKEEGLIRESQIKYVVSGPEHRKHNPISHNISHLVSNAKTDIRIANLLFNPDKVIRPALNNIDHKKVKVKGYFSGTSSGSSISRYIYALPNRYNYDLLTEVNEFSKKETLYHKKVMTFDSRYTVIGSANLGIKSSKCDYESVCIIDDPRVTKVMNDELDLDEKESLHLSGNQLSSRWNRIVGKISIKVLGTLFG